MRTIQRKDEDGYVLFTFQNGMQIRMSEITNNPLREALKRLHQLVGELDETKQRYRKAFGRVMALDPDEIAEITEAKRDGRLTIWPRLGRTLYCNGKGMCEGCPDTAEECRCCDDENYPAQCPSYVHQVPWLGGDDTEQRDMFLDGGYSLTAAEAARKIEEEDANEGRI